MGNKFNIGDIIIKNTSSTYTFICFCKITGIIEDGYLIDYWNSSECVIHDCWDRYAYIEHEYRLATKAEVVLIAPPFT